MNTTGEGSMIVLLRRRKLGSTSCRGILENSSNIDAVVRSDRPIPEGALSVIRWGTTSNLPEGVRVYNEARAIHRVADKAGSRMAMQEAGLSVPRSWRHGRTPVAGAPGPYPCIVRPAAHAQGRHVYLCQYDAQYAEAIERCGEGWYAADYIAKVAEYRVMFVQGRVAWVARKTPADMSAVAWNVAQGGRFDNVPFGEWPLRAIKESLRCFLWSGLHFGAVDVMVDAEGAPYILEINSAPSQTSPYRQRCTARCFDHMLTTGEVIPVVARKGDWKKFVHPAVSDRAVLE